MTSNKSGSSAGEHSVSRRAFLIGAGATTGAFAAGASLGAAAASTQPAGDFVFKTGALGEATVPFYGKHQAGIETPFQAHGTFLGFDIPQDMSPLTAVRMMSVLTDSARRLTEGTAPLGDNDEYMVTSPARLTVTFGFGPGLFTKLGLQSQVPTGFTPLPAYSIDKLDPAYSGGDLLIQVGTDDPLTLSHAVRQLTRNARAFANIKWSQTGFVRAQGSAPSSETPRNLFGQVDGTVNPRTPAQFDAQVWADGKPNWFDGGTQMVLRRIEMNLDTWDHLDEGGKEQSVGRRLSNGAPLTGHNEFDEPDFAAKTNAGLAVIPTFSHMRRARTDNPAEKFLRRPLSYDAGIRADGTSNVGLLFAAYMANIEKQYLPVQQRLADLDLLNTWTTPIGSAVFAIPPGCQPGGYIGEGLLS